MTTLDLVVNSDAHEDHTGANFSSSASIVNCNSHTSGVANRRYRGGFEFVLTQAIPAGSTIDVAYLTIHANSTAADDPNVDIRGEDTADAADFATTADVTSRTRTTASVQWTSTGIGTGAVNSPSIVSILQELVDDHSGLANGASIVIFLDGRSDAISTFQPMSLEGAGTEAALHFEFTPAASGVTVTPNPVTAVASQNAPTIVLGAIVVDSLVCASVSSRANPSVILGAISVTPENVSAIAGNVNPTTIQGGISLTPTAASALASTVNPGVVLGSISLTPAQAVAIGLTVNPTVEAGGNVTVTPAPVFSVAQIVNPAVVLGGLTIVPSAVESAAETADPVIVLGGLVLDLGNVTAVGLTIDPTVEISSGAIVPSPVTAVAAIVNPTTIQGDLTISGLVCAAVSYTVNPTVLDGNVEIIYDTGLIYAPALYGAIYAPDTSGVIYMPVSTGTVNS